MNAKQLKIKEAWIAEIGEEGYKDISDYINPVDGYCLGYFTYMYLNPMAYQRLRSEGEVIAYRPKSIKNIELNNLWNRIEEGLPDEVTNCYLRKDGLTFYPFLYLPTANQFEGEDGTRYDPDEFTHWQKIIEPIPPIY